MSGHDESLDAAEAMLALARSLPEDPRPGAGKSRLLASLARPGRYGVFADRLSRLFDVPIEVAARLCQKVEEGGSFRPWMAEGVEMMGVRPGPRFEGAIAAIGRLQPGARFPHHAHKGEEITLVMDGAFQDASGRIVARGEELLQTEGSAHDFVVLDRGVCIAAVLLIGGADF
jgi:hypothetical protein